MKFLQSSWKGTRKMLFMSFWFLSSPLWTVFTHCSGISIVDFEPVNDGWAVFKFSLLNDETTIGTANLFLSAGFGLLVFSHKLLVCLFFSVRLSRKQLQSFYFFFIVYHPTCEWRGQYRKSSRCPHVFQYIRSTKISNFR